MSVFLLLHLVRESTFRLLRKISYGRATKNKNTIKWIYFQLYRGKKHAYTKSQTRYPCDLFWYVMTKCPEESLLDSVGISFFLFDVLLWCDSSYNLKGSVWSKRGTSLDAVMNLSDVPLQITSRAGVSIIFKIRVFYKAWFQMFEFFIEWPYAVFHKMQVVFHKRVRILCISNICKG